MKIEIVQRLPSREEFKSLRRLVQWPIPSDELIERALANSLFGACAFIDGTLAGTGRVIGDGAIYFHIQDVIVDPKWQRKQIGFLIMEALMAYVQSQAGSGTNVGLMCSLGRERFYERFGFISRPNEKFGAGMIQVFQ